MRQGYIFGVLIAGLLAFSGYSRAQPYFNQTTKYLKANGVWAFGDSLGLNFNQGGTFFSTNAFLNTGGASIADPVTGDLMFYTNNNGGTFCWDKHNNLMPNSGGLSGSFALQGTCITQAKKGSTQYYTFYFGMGPGGTDFNLYYSLVDMSLNSGSGDIVPGQKDILLDVSLGSGMIAFPGDNQDIWLMVHDNDSSIFKAYHIDPVTGLNPVPVLSNTNSHWTDITYWFSTLAVSPNREMLALSNNFPITALFLYPSVTLFRFNAATGVVSDEMTVDNGDMSAYAASSVVFSPDNSKLYSMYQSSGPLACDFFQYNVNVYDSATIAASKYLISQSPATPNSTFDYSPYSLMKLYNDTIYFYRIDSNIMCRLTLPNLPGPAAGFQPYGMIIGGEDTVATDWTYGINNNVAIFPDVILTLLDTTIYCNNTLTIAPLHPGAENIAWEDGSTAHTKTVNQNGTYWVSYAGPDATYYVDTFKIRLVPVLPTQLSALPDCGTGNGAIAATPVTGDTTTYFYTWRNSSHRVLRGPVTSRSGDTLTGLAAGNYFLSRSQQEGCDTVFAITVLLIPMQQNLGPDSAICEGAPIHLDLQSNAPPGATILWSNGSNATSIMATDTGLFWVSVTLQTCTGADSIHISTDLFCECMPLTPTAFSPNGDGLNDIFLPVIKGGCPIQQYSLSIYNRFGQRIFTSNNAQKGWDGMFSGQPAEVGTYMYELHYTGGTQRQDRYRKGDIILVR
ncbi:gliding motility-associated C-terminal domain-containing protein [Taibaiella koreensis]|uniref:gliding motility-associated C-terminal domain-containing protein n=1 Tax=Taibaiella koreensis TaxID=1268548 RepID=UPI0013C2BD9D|nr:gliding motility-associated C-terminal domain-containing protein [Taibaiella koreensis]